MNKAWMTGAAILLAAAAAGCGSTRAEREARRLRNPAPCPNVVVLDEAGRQLFFEGGETIEDVAYTGEIRNVSSSCRYFNDEPIRQEVKIDFAFGRGPQGAAEEKVFNYFVAVTRTDVDVIAKQTFSVPIRFGNREVVTVSETIDEITIPRANQGISGNNFEIVVGFTLSREQTIYNRSGKSLKFPEL